MSEINRKEGFAIMSFPQKRIEEDTWYFIELYHLNKENSKSLSLYINSELIKETAFKQYHNKLDYDENTIGCGVQLDYVGSHGEEKIKNNFRGQMTALYFIEISYDSIGEIHRFFSYVAKNIPIENIPHYLAMPQDPKQGNTFDVKIIDKIFMHINPKYTGKTSSIKQKVYCIQKGTKNLYDIYNYVERVYHETKIDHNIVAKDIFMDIGGIKTLLPLLNLLPTLEFSNEIMYFSYIKPQKRNEIISKIIGILSISIRLDSQRCAIFLENEDGLSTLRFLLEKIAKKIPLGKFVFAQISSFLASITEYYPSLLEDAFENFLLNPTLWKNSSADIQKAVLFKASEQIFSDSHLFKPSRIIDILMNSLEAALNFQQNDENNEKKQFIFESDMIKMTVDIIRKYALKNVSEDVLIKIIAYSNLYYIRKLPRYPEQILCSLTIFLEIWLNSKDKIIKDIKNAIKNKRDSKILATLFVIAEYLIYQFENNKCEGPEYPGFRMISDDKIKENISESPHFNRQDLILIEFYKNHGEILDSILGISLYVLLKFDWNCLSDLVKDLLKEEANLTKSAIGASGILQGRKRGDLLPYMVKFVGKAKANFEINILEALYGSLYDTKSIRETLGKMTYRALFCVALDSPQYMASDYKLNFEFLHSKSKEDRPCIKNPEILEFILKQANLRFTKEAQKELVKNLAEMSEKDPRFIKEISGNPILTKLVFELPIFPVDGIIPYKIQSELICEIISQTTPHAFSRYISGNSNYKLFVLNECLNISLKNFIPINEKQGISTALKLIDFMYGIEDIISSDPDIINADIFQEVISKLLIFADKTDLIYISIPVFLIFDERPLIPEMQGKMQNLDDFENICMQREGGILRILIKIICLSMKIDKSNDFISGLLMKYLIFREKPIRKQIKQFAQLGYIKDVVKSKSKGKSKKFSLFDIFLKKDSDAIKQYSNINEFYIKKIIPNETSLLDAQKISKIVSNLSKEKNFFEYGPSLIGFLLGNLYTLVHFEIMKVKAYSEADFNNSKIIDESMKLITQKYKELYEIIQQILSGIIKYDKTNIFAEFEKFADFFCAKIKPDSGLANTEINLRSLYSFLNEKSYILGKSASAICDPNAYKILINTIKEFKQKWPEFIKKLSEIMKNPNSDINLISLLVKDKDFINILQPVLIFICGNSLSKIDNYLENVMNYIAQNQKTTSINNTENLPENNKFRDELINKIREKCANIGIPRAKIERDEFLADFDSIANSLFKHIYKEQISEVGCWLDKKHNEYLKNLFEYVKNQYQKLLKRCPLYNSLKEKNQIIENPFKEFVTLRKSRDILGRAMKLRRFDEIETNFNNSYNFSYLRRFFIKKMLIKQLCKNKDFSYSEQKFNNFYSNDMKYKFVKEIFKNVEKRQDYPIKITEKVLKNNIDNSDLDSENSRSLMSESTEFIAPLQENPSEVSSETQSVHSEDSHMSLHSDEYMPKSIFLV